MNEKLGKKYMLCSQKQIQTVFDSKTSIKSYPFVLHYCFLPLNSNKSFQITISVPKRNFKKAHDRNRIKRLLRETIRKNKLILESELIQDNLQVALFMIYTAREEMDYEILHKKTIQLFKNLTNDIQKEKTI